VKLNGTHHLNVYGDDVNLLANNINTTKKITEALNNARKETDLEANTENT
jgi:hypothetical protein